MRFVKPSLEIIPQKDGISGIYKQILLADKNHYKNNVINTEKLLHLAISKNNDIIGHGTVYLDFTDEIQSAKNFYDKEPHSVVYKNTLEKDWKIPHLFITTTYKVLYDNNYQNDLRFFCNFTKYHKRRITVKFICDLSTAKWLKSFKDFCFSQEKIEDNPVMFWDDNISFTFIIPDIIKEDFNNDYFAGNHHVNDIGNNEFIGEEGCEKDIFNEDNKKLYHFLSIFDNLEDNCKRLIVEDNYSINQLNPILPLCLKTELFMTGFVSDWWKLFNSITNNSIIYELITKLREEFINNKLTD